MLQLKEKEQKQPFVEWHHSGEAEEQAKQHSALFPERRSFEDGKTENVREWLFLETRISQKQTKIYILGPALSKAATGNAGIP